jgi:hypothetical protein
MIDSTTLSGSHSFRPEHFIGRCTLIFNSPSWLTPKLGFFYTQIRFCLAQGENISGGKFIRSMVVKHRTLNW